MNLISSRRIAQALSAMLFVLSAFSQQAAPTPSIPTTGFDGLDRYRASRIAMFTDDYGQLARYRDDNAALKPLSPDATSPLSQARAVLAFAYPRATFHILPNQPRFVAILL